MLIKIDHVMDELYIACGKDFKYETFLITPMFDSWNMWYNVGVRIVTGGGLNVSEN